MIRVILSLLLVLFLQAGCGLRGYRALYIENAALVNPTIYEETMTQAQGEDEQKTNFPVVAHRIRPGTGTVIAYRTWSPGCYFIIDDESYKKVTIYIPSVLVESGSIILGTNTDTVSMTVEGGSAWPGLGLIGIARKGFFRYRRTSPKEIDAEIELELDRYNIGWKKPEAPLHFYKHLTLRNRDVADLTAWEGREGADIYNETYP